MVITINEKNQKKYNDFFTEAYQFAQNNNLLEEEDENQEGCFESLWQYYKYLSKLASLDSTYYTKLPLDEPMMEIDGNSREIKVPAQLSRCAGIQNDHMAESIMFLIDRYHDGKDLTNATIWIQWKAQDGTEGRTAVPHVDHNFEQNKIRFPWPLTEEVTQHAGQIEFSAVFFMMIDGKNEVAYRYATLPAKINIASALLPDLGENATDTSNGFAVTVKTSNYGPGFYLPINPTFGPAQGGLDLDLSSDLLYSSTNADDLGALTLKAQATVTDTGSITYSWVYHAPKDINGVEGIHEFQCGANKTKTIASGETINVLEAAFINQYSSLSNISAGVLSSDLTINYSFGTVEESYELVTDTNNINNFDKYYNASHSLLTAEQLADAIEDNDPIYEKVSTLTLPASGPVTGYYFAMAQNTVKSNNGIDKVSDKVKSTTTVLESPEMPTVTETNPTTIIFSDGKALLDTTLDKKQSEGYIIQLYKDSTDNEGIIDESNEYGDHIEVKPEDSSISPIELSATTDGMGWYQAHITARRNRETKEVNTRVWRVVNEPVAPQIVDYTNRTADDNKNSILNITADSDDPYYYKVEVKAGLPVTLSVGIKDGETTKSISNYYSSTGRIKDLLSDTLVCRWEKIQANKTELLQESSEDAYTLTNGIGKDETVIIKCTFINTLAGIQKSTSLSFELE